MTTETCVLLWTLLLALTYLGIPASMRTFKVGLGPLAGSRDNVPAVDSIFYQRACRANENLKETLPWILALLVLVQVAGVANETTACGAWLYLGARVVYWPLYYFGVPYLRTVAWAASMAGIVMVAWPLCV